MSIVSAFTADDLRMLIRGYADALATHRETINRLNVYPVPDGDTGTNMALTLASVVTELDGAETDLDSTCQAISHGSLMGARGNSGVILSQILRGLSAEFRTAPAIDGAAFATALDAAATAAYGAVMKPVEGTILTVVRVAAEGGRSAADAGADLLGVLEAAHASGTEALARTPEMLQVLADAGVVDSGGTGLMLFFDVALNIVCGRPIPDAAEHSVGASEEFLGAFGAAHGDGSHEGSLAGLRYEVMYFLEAPDEAVSGFKDVWSTLGDSIVVVGGDGIWNCHIHTDDIGAAIEAAVEIGRPRSIRVTDLLEEVEEERWVREATPMIPEPATAHLPVPCAVVAVSVGDGIRRIFHSLGVQVIVTGGQTMNPSTAQLLEAVEAAPAEDVVLLPNNKNIIPVAEQVNAMTSKNVCVVPTRGVAEGFASLLAYDPEGTASSNVAAMTEAAAHVVAGELTRAVRDSSSDAGPIREGDWLGIARDGIIAIHADLPEAGACLLERIVNDDHEIVTIIEGEGATPAATRHLEVWVHDHRPGCEVEVHHGGQPLYPYLFGIE
ncbi:MAG: DAK2 domain-containing protein [Acidimicrobiales bacterium]